MNNHSEIVSFIWSVADLIRDTFKRGKYQDVMLPLTVLRRLDCVLAPTKADVLEKYNLYKDRLDNPDELLRRASGFAFYNTSPYDFDRLLADSANLADNLRAYIRGFSPNMRDVLDKFDFGNTITKLDESAALKVSAEVNTVENFRLSFENMAKEKFQELIEDNFKLYKKIMDDPDFAQNLLAVLLERYLKRLGSNGEALSGV